MSKPARLSKGFNSVIVVGTLLAGVIALSGQNPMRVLVASQALNGILAPPMLVLVLVIANDRRVLGRHTNGLVMNALSAIAILIMTGAPAAVLYWWIAEVV